jgi:hypothetical protein
MASKAFEKQAETLLKNLARSHQTLGRSRILIEDIETLTILTIENRQRIRQTRQSRSKSR